MGIAAVGVDVVEHAGGCGYDGLWQWVKAAMGSVWWWITVMGVNVVAHGGGCGCAGLGWVWM